LGRRRVLLIALAVPCAALLWVVAWRPFELTGDAPKDGFTRVAGVVHVHTTLSDGGGGPEEAIAAAQRAGLAFLVLTDHNNLDAKRFEGHHANVLVLVGTEISTTAGHLLGLGIEDPLFRFSGDALDALDDVRELGGAAFAAHPSSPRADFRWTGWDLPGPWGIELINGDSQWREAGWGRLLRTAAVYPLNAAYALLGSVTPPVATLAEWDRLLARRDVAGIGGADAHSRLPLSRRRSVRFPSYESIFRVVQNHVLLDRPLSGDVQLDGRAVTTALSRGRSYVGLDGLAPANAFSFTAEAGERHWTMGDTVPPDPGLRLRAGGRLPAKAQIAILRDGTPVASGAAPVEVSGETPGVYRAEVRLPGWETPWVLSNPIYVFGAPEAAERVKRAVWGELPNAPPAAVVLDRFEASSAFAAEFDPSSWMNGQVVVPGGGPEGKGAARFEFRLGEPGPARPYVSCALVERRSRDLTGRSGLVFWVRSDRPYRVWVQVRDENPASADEGTEWWFGSVRSSQEWRRVTLPFERLRTANPRSDGRLDLDKVRQLVFVLDQGAVKPGTAGTIWIAELGAY
jgi:hypothetical protein